MSVRVEVWGDYALFTRPEMKTERVSYDIMTPSAARGILEAVYWHPGLRWVIDRIYVRAPIRFANIRRNEVETVINTKKVKSVMETGRGELYISVSDNRQQRASMLLKNVHYIIEAHFYMTDKASPADNPGKFQNIINKRLRKGRCYSQPYFGCREFPAHFQLCEQIPKCPKELRGTKDLGFMLWDMDYSKSDDIRPMYFRAKMSDGMLTIPERYSGEVIG